MKNNKITTAQSLIEFKSSLPFTTITKDERSYFDLALKNLILLKQIDKNTSIDELYKLMKLEIEKLKITYKVNDDTLSKLKDPKMVYNYSDARVLICERVWTEIIAQGNWVLNNCKHIDGELDMFTNTHTYKELFEFIDNDMYINIYEFKEENIFETGVLPSWLEFLYEKMI